MGKLDTKPNHKIFTLMHERGVSQKELSDRTGIPTSTINDWKQKGTTPSSDKIALICKALNVGADEIFEQPKKNKLNQRIITEKDELWFLVNAFDNMENSRKKRLLTYMEALIRADQN